MKSRNEGHKNIKETIQEDFPEGHTFSEWKHPESAKRCEYKEQPHEHIIVKFQTNGDQGGKSAQGYK